jgi:hypothetical protein
VRRSQQWLASNPKEDDERSTRLKPLLRHCFESVEDDSIRAVIYVSVGCAAFNPASRELGTKRIAPLQE